MTGRSPLPAALSRMMVVGILAAAALELAGSAAAGTSDAPVAEVTAGRSRLPVDVALMAAAVRATGRPAALALRSLRLVDAEGRTTPLVLAQPGEGAGQLASFPLQARTSEPGAARGRVVLPSGGLPLVALRVPVGPSTAVGELTVTELALSDGELRPRTLARTLFRGGGSVRVPIPSPWAAELFVTLEGEEVRFGAEALLGELTPIGPIVVDAPRPGRLVASFDGGTGATPAPAGEEKTGELAEEEEEPVAEGRWIAPPVAPRGPLPELAPPGRQLDPGSFDQLRLLPDTLPRGTSAALKLDIAVLGETRGALASVRLLDEQDRQIPYLVEWLEEPTEMELPLLPLEPGGGGRHSRYGLLLPYAGMPPALLVLETTGTRFERQLWIEERRDEAPRRRRERSGEPTSIVASALWRDEGTGRPAPAALLELPAGAGPELVLALDEGENAPLQISRARLLMPGVGLRFVHPGGAVRLACGAPLEAPRYDVGATAEGLLVAPCDRSLTLPEASARRRARRALPEELFGIVAVAFSVLIILLIAWLLRAAPLEETSDEDDASREPPGVVDR